MAEPRYTDRTKVAILEQMLNETPSNIDKREGSITWDMLSPAATQFAQVYIELDNILELGFAETSNGDYLAMRTAELGVDRKPATKAQGTLTFTGEEGTVIAAGTQASTASDTPVLFVTKLSGTIDETGTVTVPAEAVVGGADSNIPAGAITLVVGNQTGVSAVVNEVSYDGGTDRESDADLSKRYFERVRKPATSGNTYHYLQWAKEVPGISDAQVYSLWNGPLTVKVVVLDANKHAPAPSLVLDVYNYIESVRPIGAVVTVEAAVEVPMDVSVEVALASDTTLLEVKNLITEGLTRYLADLAFVDSLVRITRIQSIILDIPRIVDYQNLTLNGATTNIEIPDGQVAVLGTVNVTVMA